LILGGHRHLQAGRQIIQKAPHFRRAQFPGMLLAVEENKPFNPLAISLFGPQRIMLKPHDLTDLIQQFEFRIGPEASARN